MKKLLLLLAFLFVATLVYQAYEPEEEIIYYTVTFETYGGSVVPQKVVANGDTITYPIQPTKEGYLFAGWYLDKACQVNFKYYRSITRDTTLYAKWVEIV